MGWDCEVLIFRHLPGRGLAWETIWVGNSKVKSLISFFVRIKRRDGYPVQLVWR